jgi:hypothetical protein
MKKVLTVAFSIVAVAMVAKAAPPPFGTVIEQCTLALSGPRAGAGVTWRQVDGMFYLVDLGDTSEPKVWKLDPEDPVGTIEQVPWQFAVLGAPNRELPWAIVWDQQLECFWCSHIVQDTICYLVRYTWNGSEWSWRGQPGDSWLVSDEAHGLDGVVRSVEFDPRTSRLWCMLTRTMPNLHGEFVRFDPGAKRIDETVRHDSIGGDGLTLVPWDSSYFLTAGGAGQRRYRKYSSTGTLLQSVLDGTGRADWALHVPVEIGPDDTVCAYCMTYDANNLFKRISTGMTWSQLPTALEQNVSPTALLSPVGAVDSGVAVVPTLGVRNYGTVPAESVAVHVMFETPTDAVLYHESTYVTIPARGSDTVEFPSWSPAPRGNVNATAWTHWPDDITPEDDTLRRQFLVRVKDVAVTEVYRPVPDDTIDPGFVRPRCQVWNYGNTAATFPVVFGIEDWRDTVMVTDLQPGTAGPATAQDSIRLGGDTLPWNGMVATMLDGDMYPDNNDTAFQFWVRGAVEHDLALTIEVPAGSLLVNDQFTPVVLAVNNAVVDEEFWLYLTLMDSQPVVVASDSIQAMVPAGMPIHLAFQPQAFSIVGRYMAACSADIDPRNWETDTQTFWIARNIGMAEGKSQPLRFGLYGVEPNPFSGTAVVQFGLPLGREVDLAVYSASGRRVRELTTGLRHAGLHTVVWDGTDDAGRAVGRGVYCLRLVADDRVASRKLVKME